MSARPPADALLATVGTGRTNHDIESGLLVEALGERGVRARLVAWDADVDWGRVALVVVRTPWDYTDRHERFLEWVRATAAITSVVNDAELIAWNIHKGYLVELGHAGVPVVPTSLVPRGAGIADVHDVLAAHAGEVVIKPAISAGARGAIRVDVACEQAASHVAALLEAGDALIQPYVRAVESGEVSLMYFDGVLSHAVRKLPAGGDFRVQVEHGGSVEPHVATAAECAVADAVLAAVPAPACYARIDLVTAEQGPLLMEAELIEPELFLPDDRGAPARFAEVLARRIRASSA